MNGNLAYDEHRRIAEPEPEPCDHQPGNQYVYADPNTGRAYYGCRACGLTVGPVTPCQDDLTLRPRPCGCVGTEQSCAACRFAATIAALNEHAAERRKPYVFDVADGRLRAQMGGMTIRFFFDATDAWAWEGAQ